MKKAILFLLFLSLAANAQTLAPVPISSYSTGVNNAWYNGASITSPSLILWAKTPFQGGPNNCAIMAVSSQNTLTQSTPTDDHGETWVAGPSVTDAAYHMTLKLWYVLGTTARTSKITVPTTGTTSNNYGDYLGATLTEVQNCNTSVGVGGNGTMDTAATESAIDITLSAAPTSGDMVLASFLDASGNGNLSNGFLPFVSSITPGSGYTALTNSLSFGKMMEYGTSTTSATVPVTYSGNDTILGVAIVIKQGPAGTGPPSGMYIDHFQVEQHNGSTNTHDFPCSGNLIVGLMDSGGLGHISSIASNGAATWNVGVFDQDANFTSSAQIFYGSNATCSSSMTVTPTWTGTPNYPGTEVQLASVTNAAASPFDVSHVTEGEQTSNGNVTMDTITPSNLNEMVFNASGIEYHSITGTVTDSNGHTPVSLVAVDSKGDDAQSGSTATQPSTLTEDNGDAIYINTADTLPITFIYPNTAGTNPPNGIAYWTDVSAAFKGAQSGNALLPPTGLTAMVH